MQKFCVFSGMGAIICAGANIRELGKHYENTSAAAADAPSLPDVTD